VVPVWLMTSVSSWRLLARREDSILEVERSENVEVAPLAGIASRSSIGVLWHGLMGAFEDPPGQ
jgi:hypothetical protein